MPSSCTRATQAPKCQRRGFGGLPSDPERARPVPGPPQQLRAPHPEIGQLPQARLGAVERGKGLVEPAEVGQRLRRSEVPPHVRRLRRHGLPEQRERPFVVVPQLGEFAELQQSVEAAPVDGQRALQEPLGRLRPAQRALVRCHLHEGEGIARVLLGRPAERPQRRRAVASAALREADAHPAVQSIGRPADHGLGRRPSAVEVAPLAQLRRDLQPSRGAPGLQFGRAPEPRQRPHAVAARARHEAEAERGPVAARIVFQHRPVMGLRLVEAARLAQLGRRFDAPPGSARGRRGGGLLEPRQRRRAVAAPARHERQPEQRPTVARVLGQQASQRGLGLVQPAHVAQFGRCFELRLAVPGIGQDRALEVRERGFAVARAPGRLAHLQRDECGDGMRRGPSTPESHHRSAMGQDTKRIAGDWSHSRHRHRVRAAQRCCVVVGIEHQPSRFAATGRSLMRRASVAANPTIGVALVARMNAQRMLRLCEGSVHGVPVYCPHRNRGRAPCAGAGWLRRPARRS